MTLLRRIYIIALMSTLAFTASGSAIFDGTNTNVWIVDPLTGRIDTYRLGTWSQSFAPGGAPLIGLIGMQQGLVNQLANSSSPMNAQLPPISVVGFSQAALFNANEAPSSMRIFPQSGSYTDTIIVKFLLDQTLIEQSGVELTWQVNGEQDSVAVTEENTTPEGGFRFVTLPLVNDGDYAVSATLTRGTDTLAVQSANYALASDHPQSFRRDTDGDGIPDLVEAEIGLDLSQADLDYDADGDGWSEFDAWLRQDMFDGQRLVDASGTPIDSDGDGWSDFDEQLRGTRVNDPEVVLDEVQFGAPDSENYRRETLRYKDFPAARRLYEVEHSVTGDLNLPAFESDMTWQQVEVVSIYGQAPYDSNALLSEEEVKLTGLAPEDFAQRLQRAEATNSLSSMQIPPIRLAASDPLVLSATLTNGDYTQIAKVWLAPKQELSPAAFMRNAEQTWQTAEQFRRAFVDYLRANLVKEQTLLVDQASTTDVALVELILSEESALSGGKNTVLFIPSEQYGASKDLLERFEQDLGELSSADISLEQWRQKLLESATTAAHLQEISTWVSAITEAPQPGIRTDLTTVRRFWQSFDLAELGCYLPDSEFQALQASPEALSTFLDGCPEFYTDSDLQTLVEQDRARRHALRLHIIPNAIAEIVQDTSLLAFDSDSDSDGASNSEELAARLLAVTRPWQSDFDGDGITDADDFCPRDPLDLCSTDPALPDLILTDIVQTSEPGPNGGYALISVSLGSVARQDVTFDYQTQTLGTDDAEAGQDYTAVTGQATIAAGEQVAIIRIPILSDTDTEELENFSLVISNVQQANLLTDGIVRITINDQAALPPEAMVAQNALTVDERAQVELDASNSSDPVGLALTYFWRQTDDSGVAVVLSDNASVTPTFAAPVTLTPLNLTFEVEVTNSVLLADTESVTVTVNPVDDPPQVIASAAVSFETGQRFDINAETLLASVEEPDGEPLIIERILTQPGFGSAELENNTVTIDVSEAELQEIAVAENAGQATKLSEDSVLFVASPAQGSDELTHFALSTQKMTTLLPLEDDAIDTILPSPKTGEAWFYQSARQTLSHLGSALEIRQISYPTDLSLAVVDEQSGDLFVCDASVLGTWQRVAAVDLSQQDTFLTCTEEPDLHNAALDGRFCVAQGNQLSCLTTEGELQRVASETEGKIEGLHTVDSGLLAFVSQVEGESTTGSNFGFRVQVSGDWMATTQFTGENNELLLYQRQQGAWEFRQTLTAPELGSFAADIALDGEFLAASSNSDQTLVYRLQSNQWTLSQRIDTQTDINLGFFARRVSLYQNVLAVASVVPNQPDAVELYRLNAGVWEFTQTITVDGVVWDDWGFARAFAGDWMAISGPSARVEGASSTGKVRLYRMEAGQYQFVQEILPPGGFGTISRFANTLAMDDREGLRLVIGATGAGSAGAAFVFELQGDTWQQTAALTNPVFRADNAFGSSVAIDGDLVAIGAPVRDNFDGLDPLVALFSRSAGGSWSHNGVILRDEPGVNASFGFGLQLQDDLLFASAYRRDAQGGIDVFNRSGDRWDLSQSLFAEASTAKTFLARVYAADGEFNDVLSLPSEASYSPPLVQLNDGSVTFMAEDAGTIRQYLWSGVWDEMAMPNPGFVGLDGSSETTVSARVGVLAQLNEQMFWWHQSDVEQKSLYRLNIGSGQTLLTRSENNGTQLLPSLVSLSGSPVFSRPSAPGLCDFLSWQDGIVERLLSDVDCQAFTVGDKLMFKRLDRLMDGNALSLLQSDFPTGETSFSVEVADPGGNGVELPVNMVVTPKGNDNE